MAEIIRALGEAMQSAAGTLPVWRDSAIVLLAAIVLVTLQIYADVTRP